MCIGYFRKIGVYSVLKRIFPLTPGIMCNNYSSILTKEYAACGALMIDHTSNYIFYFIQTSSNSNQTVEAKYKFKTFA